MSLRISIFGTGYVGLVTGTCFAEMGNEVICADIDSNKIQQLNRGISPIFEPGLEALIHTNSKDHRLSFTTDLKKTVEDSDLLFIAVGTPSDEDGSADLKYVLDVAKTIATHMNGYKAVLTKSTVPVGTAYKVIEVIQATLKERKVSFDFDVISNPEFLKEGSAIEDCLKPSRIVVGCETERAKEWMSRLYEPFVRNGRPLLFMDLLSSEMTKYAANSILATKISFMNELSRICEKVGADIEKVRHGIGSDPRIGYEFIYPGLGYGGSCFPKDVKALIKTGEDFGDDLHILKAVEATNKLQRKRFFQKIEKHFDGHLKGKKIALWGLAFKPGTDDVRDAPSLTLIHDLLQAGADISAFDPVAVEATKKDLGSKADRIRFVDSQYDALTGADALCIVTEWKHFREPNFDKIKSLMKQPIIFDGRNLYDPKALGEMGFIYFSIGRTSGESSLSKDAQRI